MSKRADGGVISCMFLRAFARCVASEHSGRVSCEVRSHVKAHGRQVNAAFVQRYRQPTTIEHLYSQTDRFLGIRHSK